MASDLGNLLKQNKLDDCINLAKQYKSSHLAKVFSAGLLEFKADSTGGYNVIAKSDRSHVVL